jgi:uncharacterized membrane protein
MRLLARAIVLAAFLWVVALAAAPTAIASSTRWPSRMAVMIYAAGRLVCHQRPDRSFTEAGRALPVCARCTGLYVSALAGGLVALAGSAGALAPSRARWLLLVAGTPTAITWLSEIAGLAHPSNIVRAVAAVPLGGAVAWVVVTMLMNDAPTSASRREV